MKTYFFALFFSFAAHFSFAASVTVNSYTSLSTAVNGTADTIYIDGTIIVQFVPVSVYRDIVFIGINNGTLDGNNSSGIMQLGGTGSIERIGFDNLTFRNANTYGQGGAILTASVDIITVNNCRFVNNKAMWGGAIYGTDIEYLLLENCEFTGNNAEVGGAIWVSGKHYNVDVGKIYVINCLFDNNSATQATGALDTHSWKTVTVFNSVFTNNDSGSTDPGAICLGGNGQTNIINCTIAKNHSDGNAGAIGLWGKENLNIYNCVLTGNTDRNGNAADISRTPVNYMTSTVKMYNSVYQNIINPVTLSVNVNNFGNVQPNSTFVDFANSDFHLSRSSAAINSGSDNDYVTQWNTSFPANIITNPAVHFDIDGNSRAIYTIDMGAYESNYSENMISDSFCENTTYDFNGKILTESGIYYDTIPNVFGGDSIITLNLTENPAYFQTEDITVCDSQLPFTYRDSVFLSSGIKNIVYQTIQGCDSIIAVNLTVQTSDITRDTLSICVDLLPYSYNDTIFEPGTQSGDYYFQNGCSDLILNLNILSKIEMLPPDIPKICADDENFILQFSNTDEINTKSPTNFEIIFDNKALAAGFVNQNGIIGGNNEITVQMPDKIYPDYYNCKIVLSDSIYNCAPQTFDIQFSVFYPDSIMEQKWDDVVALKNANYNGGFDFTGYQWYKNGEILTGETYSYIYLNGNILQLGDKYSVLITRNDGSQIFSCELDVQPPRPQTTNRPYVVQNGNSMIIYTSQNATVYFWTITGILTQSAQISAPQSIISAPVTGAYILEILPENQTEDRTVLPIIINNTYF